MEILLFALRYSNVSVGSFWLSLCIESYFFLMNLRKFKNGENAGNRCENAGNGP